MALEFADIVKYVGFGSVTPHNMIDSGSQKRKKKNKKSREVDKPSNGSFDSKHQGYELPL